MKRDLSRGENLILRILRASTRGIEDVGRDLGNTANATRWITLDSSASECASNALMGYDVLLTGSIIPHRNRDELAVARQKYSDAWSVVLKEVGELLPGSEQYVRAMRLWRTVDASLVDYVEDCLCERNAASVAELKDALRGVSDELRINTGKKPSKEKCTSRILIASRFAGENWFNIHISADGRKIEINRNKVWLSFAGKRQWQIIDALFVAWKDNFGKAEIGDKSEIEKVFGSKHGRYLLKFIHFETRKEAGLAKKRGNYQYTGNAWFDRKLIYPDKFALKKE